MKRISTMLVALFLAAITFATAFPTGATPTDAPATAQNAQEITITRSGAKPPQQGTPERFTGSVRIDPLFDAQAPSRMLGVSVTFAPGARSAWHTHPLGQTLIVTAGVGLVQRWGGPIQEMRKGDVVRIPSGVKHWHGASPHSAMTHLAVLEELDGTNTTWMEKVSDADYRHEVQGVKTMNKEPSAIKKSLGDFAPKMVQLTDDVLFGDVWERPELSPRDRSLITVAALTVGGNAEQLPFHLTKAKENGLSETEIVEAITHLAFYTGWPRALSAINVAKTTFQKPPAPPAGEK